MSEGSGAALTESIFCGACGAGIDPGARFCRSCGADQLQFSEPEPEPEPALSAGGGLRDALTERHGFAPSQPPLGDGAFEPGEGGVVGALEGLPLRVEEGSRPEGGAPLIRVRFGLAGGDPEAVKKALSEVPAWRVSAGRTGVEVLAAQEDSGGDTDAVLTYVEDLARRAAAAMESEKPPSDSARALTVCGYPQWVQTPDTTDVDGVQLRHFELENGEAEWEELAVRLAPSADGAMFATGTWDEEEPFISLMGRVVLMRQDDGGRETSVMFGSGLCTLTNRRLLAVVYARPDDDVLQSLGQGMRESGITFQDSSGRSVDPYSLMPEEDKALQFIDEAGAVDEQGCGVVLALSAFPQAFARVDLEGSVLVRGLGIPMMHLSGSPLDFKVVPFRVLDSNSHTVKPRRGQIKDAVNSWWAMTAQAGH